jgi:hypothetical protein
MDKHLWIEGEATTICGESVHWGRARLLPDTEKGGADEGTPVPGRARACAACSAGGVREDALAIVLGEPGRQFAPGYRPRFPGKATA